MKKILLGVAASSAVLLGGLAAMVQMNKTRKSNSNDKRLESVEENCERLAHVIDKLEETLDTDFESDEDAIKSIAYFLIMDDIAKDERTQALVKQRVGDKIQKVLDSMTSIESKQIEESVKSGVAGAVHDSCRNIPISTYSLSKTIENAIQKAAEAQAISSMKSISFTPEDVESSRTRLKIAIAEYFQNFKIPSYKSYPEIDNIIDDVAAKVFDGFELTDADASRLQQKLKESICAEIESYVAGDYIEKIIDKTVTNELYSHLKKDKEFWSAVDIYAGRVREEAVLLSMYEQFRDETESNADVKRFDFFVLRRAKCYYIWEVVELNNGTVITKNGMMKPSNQNALSEKTSDVDYETVCQRRLSSGYIKISGHSYLENRLEKMLIERNETRNKKAERADAP